MPAPIPAVSSLSLEAPDVIVPGSPMTLRCDDNLATAKRTWKVEDTSGTVWTLVSQNDDTGAVFTATAGETGGTITATITRTWDKKSASDTIEYSVEAPTTDDDEKKNIGMSSPKALWDQRLREVGENGIKSRRIYADLSSSGISQRSLIDEAVADGLVPVVSVKFPDFNRAAAGDYNAWARTAASQLNSYDTKVLIAAWHEPYDNMDGATWLKIQRHLLPIFGEQPNLETYCILHGWLFDNRIGDINSFMSSDVMDLLDYFGVDSYQSGTMSNPGNKDLSTRMPIILDWLDDKGVPDKPLVIGEFSAYTAQSLNNVGEAILSTPNVKYALLFNSNTGGKGEPLVPGTARMTEFKEIKSDDRALQ